MTNVLKKGLLTGLGIGLAVGDTVGAVVGAGLGYAVDKLSDNDVNNNNISTILFVGMTVALAKIDDNFDEREEEKILEDIKALEDRALYELVYSKYIEYKNTDNLNVIELAKEYDSKVTYDKEDREFIYEYLFQLACIDDNFDEKEQNILKELLQILRLNEDLYNKMSKKYIPEPIVPTQSLEELIGLNSVKQNINDIINAIKIEKLRGGKAIAGHYIFQGNPGTGKTTVARILGAKFKELGLLSKGHFVEVKREDLVGEYIGHTAIKTKEILEKSLGGILFIDEVYTLSTGGETDFGKEAINAIVPFIEDNRDKFIVIIAGYTNEMNDFLDTNPGLKSRFNNTINFEDYTSEEMFEIFTLIAKDFKYDTQTAEKIKNHFKYLEDTKDQNFGNARDVRKTFEAIKKNQINRLIQYPDIKEQDERLYIFEEADIQF